MQNLKGKLFIVPTPIGNLEDITIRALETLKNVNLILAEDTRKTGMLLKHFAVQKPLKSYHTHNEHQELERILARLQGGDNLALVCDAGTPAISDPGFLLIRACLKSEIEVECLPGATAFVPALVMSGLPNDKFVFEGFLPHKKGRKKRLGLLSQEERTMVFYESPHRLLKSLEQMLEFFGEERQAVVVRELTKVFEETIRGSLQELKTYFEEKNIKGEIVLVVSGKNN